MKPISLVAATATTLVVLLLLFSSPCEAGIECSVIIEYLKPCVAYLQAKGGPGIIGPSGACCDGARHLVAAARSVQDKRDACNCIKVAAQILNPNTQNARDLPSKCGILLPFEISPFMDCSRIG